MKRLSQRYTIATIGFAIAAFWTGLSLTSAFECLFAFISVYTIAGALQRGETRVDDARVNDSRRSRSRRSRRHPPRSRPPRERSAFLRDNDYDRLREPPRRSEKAVYDLDRHGGEDEWAHVADGG